MASKLDEATLSLIADRLSLLLDHKKALPPQAFEDQMRRELNDLYAMLDRPRAAVRTPFTEQQTGERELAEKVAPMKAAKAAQNG